MKNKQFSFLKALNLIHLLSIFFFIPFMLTGGFGSSPSRPRDNLGIINYVWVIAIPAFLSTIATFYVTHVDRYIGFKKDMFKVQPNFSIPLFIFIVINSVIAVLFSSSSSYLPFIIAMIISSCLLIINKNFIKELEAGPIYSVNPVWYIAMIPVVFISSFLLCFALIDISDLFCNLFILVFLLMGAMAVPLVNHKWLSVNIDTDKKVIICDDNEDLSLQTHIQFHDITGIAEAKMFYIIKCKGNEYKLLKGSTNLKRSFTDLKDYGIRLNK